MKDLGIDFDSIKKGDYVKVLGRVYDQSANIGHVYKIGQINATKHSFHAICYGEDNNQYSAISFYLMDFRRGYAKHLKHSDLTEIEKALYL